MEDSFIMHVEDSKGCLDCPIDYLFLREFCSDVCLDELVDVSPWAVFHDDVEASFLVDDVLPIGHDADMFELFEQFDFVEDVLFFLVVFTG